MQHRHALCLLERLTSKAFPGIPFRDATDWLRADPLNVLRQRYAANQEANSCAVQVRSQFAFQLVCRSVVLLSPKRIMAGAGQRRQNNQPKNKPGWKKIF